MDVGGRAWRRVGRTPPGVARALAPRDVSTVHRSCYEYRTMVALTTLGVLVTVVLACAAWTRMPEATPVRFFATESAGRSSRDTWLFRTLLRALFPVVALVAIEAKLLAAPRRWARGQVLRRWASSQLWPVFLVHLRTFLFGLAWLTVPVTLASVLASIGYHHGAPMPALVPTMISAVVFVAVISVVRFARVLASPPSVRVRDNPWVIDSTPWAR